MTDFLDFMLPLSWFTPFFLGTVFTEKFADQNHQFWKFSKKLKKGRFCTAKLAP